MSSSSSYLPNELVIDILSRLPVKTLIRFTCVCKAWYSLIRNPNFITTHLNRSISSSYANNGYILILSWSSPVKTTIRFISSNETSCSVLCENTFIEHAKLDFPRDTGCEYPKIVGSCNGVLCLIDRNRNCFDGFDVCLWNPSIRKYKTLPCSLLDVRLDVIRFVFCRRTNDFKVVRILYFRDESDDDCDISMEPPPKVEVYSLSTNSWRRIGATVPLITDDEEVAFVNGAIHWMAAKAKFFRPYDSIMSFDVADEIFGEITLPTNYLDEGGAHTCVMAFKGSLSLFVYFFEGSERCYIWVMREYGVTESWTKQFTIVPPEKVCRSLGFTKNGQLILQLWDKVIVSNISCDLENLLFEDLKIPPRMYDADATFMESLVLLEEGNVELGPAN